MYLETDQIAAIRQWAADHGTRGYRIIADGKQTAFPRWSKRLERELGSITAKISPTVFTNCLGETAIDFDLMKRFDGEEF